MGTRVTQAEMGFASTYLKHQSRVPGASGHSIPEDSILPKSQLAQQWGGVMERDG